MKDYEEIKVEVAEGIEARKKLELAKKMVGEFSEFAGIMSLILHLRSTSCWDAPGEEVVARRVKEDLTEIIDQFSSAQRELLDRRHKRTEESFKKDRGMEILSTMMGRDGEKESKEERERLAFALEHLKNYVLALPETIEAEAIFKPKDGVYGG